MNRLSFPRVVVVLMAACAGSAVAQQPSREVTSPGIEQISVRGSVHDSTGRPLEGAEVRLDSAAIALTDARGEFTLLGAHRATLRLHVRRLGYLAKDTVISPSASEGRVAVSITLSPNALQLGVIVVEGRALDTRLWDAGYYHRKRLGTGRFVGPEELDRFGSGLATVVRETPRVQMDRQNNQEFAYARVGGHRCRMNIFVDGNYARFASPGVSGNGPHDRPDPGVGLDGVVPREDIRAVEIYPSLTSVPSQFLRIGPASNQASQGSAGRLGDAAAAGRPSTRQQEEGPSDAACGAIVIWTKWYAARRQPAANSP
jgi:hypothetical protein